MRKLMFAAVLAVILVLVLSLGVAADGSIQCCA